MQRLILLFSVMLIAVPASGKSEKECLQQMSEDTAHTQEEIATILMSCNNILLDGQNLYMRNTKAADKLIRKRWPAQVDPLDDQSMVDKVSEWEMAERLFNHSVCEMMAHNVKVYMRQCVDSDRLSLRLSKIKSIKNKSQRKPAHNQGKIK